MQKPIKILRMTLMMPKEHDMLSSNKPSNANHIIKMKRKLYPFSSIIIIRKILKVKLNMKFENLLCYYFFSILNTFHV